MYTELHTYQKSKNESKSKWIVRCFIYYFFCVFRILIHDEKMEGI